LIQIYGIKNCDNVKKAIRFFKQNELEYTLNDLKINTISCEKVSSWLKKSDIKTVFNARSTTYRNLKLKEKNLSPEEQKEWLCKENLLIKRPIIEFQDRLVVGYNEDNYKDIFL